MKTLNILLLLAIISLPATAQMEARIRLFYQEPQVGKVNDDVDSIEVYVREPFQPMRIFSNPDLGYETSFNFTIDEFCPIQVCKNNQCIDLFIDSEEVQILINPEQFKQSKSLNSPLSEEWRTIMHENKRFFEVQTDSLAALFKQQQTGIQIEEFYKYFNDRFKQLARGWIMRNANNAVGWALFLRSPELFETAEIFTLSHTFNASLSCKSTELIKTRLTKYNNLKDPTKSIYSVFALE